MKQENKFNVPAHIWKMWSEAARRVFNGCYGTTGNTFGSEDDPGYQLLYAVGARPVVRWNLAFIAAFACDGYEIVGAVDG